MRQWIVLKEDFVGNCWREVGCANEETAFLAFRTVVLRPRESRHMSTEEFGRYRVLPLTDSGYYSIEARIVDLDHPDNHPARS